MHLKLHYLIHHGPSMVPVISQISPIHSIPPYLFKIHFIFVLPPTSTPSPPNGHSTSDVPAKTLHAYVHTCHIPHPIPFTETKSVKGYKS